MTEQHVLVKRGKYLEGHSYATGLGYSFSWTADPAKARRFDGDDPTPDTFAQRTGARIVAVSDGVAGDS